MIQFIGFDYFSNFIENDLIEAIDVLPEKSAYPDNQLGRATKGAAKTLLAKVKIAHGRRVFCLPKKDKTILSLRDINKGYDMFLDNLGKKDNNITRDILSHMYV